MRHSVISSNASQEMVQIIYELYSAVKDVEAVFRHSLSVLEKEGNKND